MDKQKENKKITTIPELAKMINRSFQSNQEYMDKRFYEFGGKLDEFGGKLGKAEKVLKVDIKKVWTKKITKKK